MVKWSPMSKKRIVNVCMWSGVEWFLLHSIVIQIDIWFLRGENLACDMICNIHFMFYWWCCTSQATCCMKSCVKFQLNHMHTRNTDDMPSWKKLCVFFESVCSFAWCSVSVVTWNLFVFTFECVFLSGLFIHTIDCGWSRAILIDFQKPIVQIDLDEKQLDG